ncbi:hypothetical protein ACFU5O_16870 [Streptomyces sp. NPDC057445]|uniref:hypothetical protein n=1 Tax=Streptomyces sp. NPDC057445 TaxID=3346136 RepID=UPI00368E6863
MRQRSRGRVTLAGVAAMCAVMALPGGTARAEGGPGPYVFDEEAKRIQGAAVNTNAEPLEAGSTYRDTIKKDGKLYYRVDLDAKTNAYVSVVAVPKQGGKAEYGDGIKVSLESRSNSQCSSQDALFESAGYTRPVAAYADRTVDPGSSTCQEQGAYYVLVERTSKATSAPDDWELEIRYDSEPALRTAGPTEAPEDWPSASPAPPEGGPQKRVGGTSFSDAMSLGQGEWRDDIKPGQTLFYRVPVDWGQQLFVGADLGTSTTSDSYIGNAFVLSLNNPARGYVDRSTVSYSGKQASTALDPLPPVAYENRYDSDNAVQAVRFAGWYYLSATLSPELAKKYGDKSVPLTLRVNVTGKAKQGPGYDGAAGIFGVTDDDQEAAAIGQSGPGAERSGTMKLVAAAGIGAGAVLVLGLGAWTLLARRRGAQGPQQPGGYGPPAAW